MSKRRRSPSTAGRVLVAMSVLVAISCAPAPTPQTPGPRPRAPIDLNTKVSWIVRLEHQRVLRDSPAAGAAAEAAETPVDASQVPSFSPATEPDLTALVLDPDPTVRRRAALAIGRVGIADGVSLLVGRLTDPERGVREMAAFGLGLLGDRTAVAPLTLALQDASASVRARAIEALGQIGDPAAAGAIAGASTGCAALLAPLQPDDEEWPKSAEIEACRLALFALVRLEQQDALRSVALDAQGRPISRWWPVAFALQRSGVRDADALLALASSSGIYTRAFALRGLAGLEEQRVVPMALALAGQQTADVKLRVAAVRALRPFAPALSQDVLLSLLRDPATPPNLLLEALSGLRGDGTFDLFVSLFADPWPALRAAAMRQAGSVDADAFLVILSSLGPDPDWSVRAALASTLADLSVPFERVQGWLEGLAADQDVRVRVAALEALAAADAPDADSRITAALGDPDYTLRASAARLMGRHKPDGGVASLAEAYERGDSDAAPDARSAALSALAEYGGPEAIAVLRRALGDREWPVRLLAARLLRRLGETEVRPERPAPIRQPAGFFESDTLLHPSFSPHAFIETRHGTIEIELNVVQAPVTSLTFIELARSGFFNGIKVHRLIPHFVIQAGDPRGSGSGGPGFTQRDEPGPQPFLRGTVGMALSGPDTAGSQFFITLSPQPHLDGDYTVFGQVVAGDEVLDQVMLWDVIERVRIWDGVTFR